MAGFYAALILGLLLPGLTEARKSRWQSMRSEEVRKHHSTGITLHAVGEPFASMVGLGLSFNMGGHGRFSFSVGQSTFGSIRAVAVGGNFKVLWLKSGLTPYVSLGGSHFPQSPLGSLSHMYGGAGIDWQTRSGLNLGVGYNISFVMSDIFPGLPSGYLGVYF